jgi:hypothetical protein
LHVADAFALGIILIELLTSGDAAVGGYACDVTLSARAIYDGERPTQLSEALQAKALANGWAQGGAKEAAKVLSDVAVTCVEKTTWRHTPAQVLPLLKAAHKKLEKYDPSSWW